jgi:hypothetical protein
MQNSINPTELVSDLKSELSSEKLSNIKVSETVKNLKTRLNSSKESMLPFHWDIGVASQSEIMQDFNSPTNIDIIPNNLITNFTLRSIPGHTSEGHSKFRIIGHRPNTTIDDVFEAYQNETGIDMYKQSQKEINKVGKAIERCARANPNETIKLKENLFDNPLFNNFKALNFNKGFFYGGNFDNFEGIRKHVLDEFGVNTGGGECELVDKNIVRLLGIDLTEFTSGNFKNELLNSLTHDERIKVFNQIGLIKPKTNIDFEHVTSWRDVLDQTTNYTKDRDTFQQYIRTRKGGGVSDDMACMAAMYIDFNPEINTPIAQDLYSLQVGGNVADFCDTFTKATSQYVPGGFDQVLADFANHLFVERIKNEKRYRDECEISSSKLEEILENPEFGLVSKNQLIDIVALVRNPAKKFYEKGIEPRGTGTEQIHSSARYFIKQVNEDSIESYTLEQEIIANFDLLNRQLAMQGHKEVDPLEVLKHNTLIPDQSIGFHGQNLHKVTNFMHKNITSILSQPQEKRRELIHKLYS